jgi:hypothetical protein
VALEQSSLLLNILPRKTPVAQQERNLSWPKVNEPYRYHQLEGWLVREGGVERSMS